MGYEGTSLDQSQRKEVVQEVEISNNLKGLKNHIEKVHDAKKTMIDRKKPYFGIWMFKLLGAIKMASSILRIGLCEDWI